VERRYGSGASIEYIDASDPENRITHGEMIDAIHDRGLIYPVTVVDGTPMYDGAVSYPAILRAIDSRIGATTGS
jgi:disulfide oxidoreductase YuzD